MALRNDDGTLGLAGWILSITRHTTRGDKSGSTSHIVKMHCPILRASADMRARSASGHLLPTRRPTGVSFLPAQGVGTIRTHTDERSAARSMKTPSAPRAWWICSHVALSGRCMSADMRWFFFYVVSVGEPEKKE
jgi:hypothetical protein